MDKLKELVSLLDNASEVYDAYMIWKVIEELAKEQEEVLKPSIEEFGNGEWDNEKLLRHLSLYDKKTSTLLIDNIKERLSDQECRELLKPTESMLKAAGRKDLLTDSFRTYSFVKSIRVTKLEEKTNA